MTIYAVNAAEKDCQKFWKSQAKGDQFGFLRLELKTIIAVCRLS